MLPKLRCVPLAALACLTFAADSVSAQATDYTVSNVRVLQILEGTNLVGERPVTVRTMIAVSGPNDPTMSVDALMRVYVDGVEASDSPVYSHNGPILVEGNSALGQAGTMLNFTYIPPVSTDVEFEVQLNPPGPNFVPEADTGNNTTSSGSLSFREQELLTLMYSPIDYRVGGGGTPNLPDNELIKPGVGDAFVQGIYPGGVIEYRRTDAPSKLWTSSLNSSGSGLNNSLNTDLLLTSPRPDYIYGWVPGGLPYNGQAFINGKASMGNTESIRHQRTYAHELGHNFGQFHNSFGTGAWGEDVERHLLIPNNLKKIKGNTLNDIMVPGQLTPSAWINGSIHQAFYNHPNLALPATDSGNDAPVDDVPTPHLLVSGRWDRASGALHLEPVITVMADEASSEAPAGLADLVLRGHAGGDLVRQFTVSARNSGDEGGCAHEAGQPEGADSQTGDTDSAAHVDPVTHFSVLVPAHGFDGRAIDGLTVSAAGTQPVQPATRSASLHAPEVGVLSPRVGDLTPAQITVSWEASDLDGDALFTTLRYLPDGNAHSVPLVVNTTASEHTVDLTELPQFVPGRGCFELLVTDGFRTTTLRTPPLNGPGGYEGVGGAAPFVELYFPDDGTSFNKGANVILHSSGWDLEDQALNGASVVWTSDLDGNLGSGRRFIVSDLSVGTHQLTVTASDSAGQQSFRTHTITINDRDLPNGEVCAVDLGFGGPGSSVLSLCGGDLTQGGTATLQLDGAPRNTPAFLLLGLSNNPTALKGGLLVPVPWASLIDLTTDGSGSLSIPGVPGLGGAPLSVFLQCVLVDNAQAQGFGFSNALQATF